VQSGNERMANVPGSTNRNQKSKKELHVNFASLEIREYPIQMGDSPASASGIPITIGWEYSVVHQCLPIDDYEELRPERRSQHELKMDPLHRLRLLKEQDNGSSTDEIREGIQQVDQARMKRRRTVERLRFAPIEETWEAICRVAVRSTVRRSRCREYRRYLAKWRENLGDDHGVKTNRYTLIQNRDRKRIAKLNAKFNSRCSITDGTACTSSGPVGLATWRRGRNIPIVVVEQGIAARYFDSSSSGQTQIEDRTSESSKCEETE
jgi:hypothetical protein